jgi:hypothetical protein
VKEEQLDLDLSYLTSCDFVGDSGCSDPDCWQCHSGIGPQNLRTLAQNLAAAAARCRAWQRGRAVAPFAAWEWGPGCGVEAPALGELCRHWSS